MLLKDVNVRSIYVEQHLSRTAEIVYGNEQKIENRSFDMSFFYCSWENGILTNNIL